MPKQLLVADDSLTIRKVIGMVFAVEDVSITFVDNGSDAVARARELRPDCVLADVLMPGKSGYEVCEAIKSDPATASIRVLLLAGNFEPFDEARARAVRADDFIIKPFESQALIDKVRALVGLPAGVSTPVRTYAPATSAEQVPFAPRPRAPMAGMPARAPLAGSGFTPAAGLPRPQGAPATVPQPMPGPAGVPRPPGATTASHPVVNRPSAFPSQRAPSAPPSTQSIPGLGRPPAPQPYMPAAPRAPVPPGTTPGLPRPPGASLPTQSNPSLARPAPQPYLPSAPPRASAPLSSLQPRARESFVLGPNPALRPPPPPREMPQSVEEMTLDVGLVDAPTPVVMSQADGGEAALRAALKNASQEVIERIAWEVVPQLAETIVREYVERTMREREAKA